MLALRHSRKTNSDHPGCHVECDLGCQTNSAPEFRYIMHLAAETDRWTHKLLLSFSTAGQTSKPESFYTMPLLLGGRRCHAGFVFMQIRLCRRPVIESFLFPVLQSNLNIAHAMLTLMQCLHVDSTVRCQADEAPEFRYIMLLAAEAERWTDKLLGSIPRIKQHESQNFVTSCLFC